MLKILLLDCPDSLHEKLLREGFDVEVGTIGMCTGIRRLPSQVYEKDIIFYSPERLHANVPDAIGHVVISDSIKDETPHFPLSNLDARIKSGATLVAFLNPVHRELSRQRRLYDWIPEMPPLEFTHDKIVYGNRFDEYAETPFKDQLAPVVVTDELSIPTLIKLKPPKYERQAFCVPVVVDLFWNGNGECLGLQLLHGQGRLILLPKFKSNCDMIEIFLHRVVPKIYKEASPSGLMDLYRSPLEANASAELAELLILEKEVRERQGIARSQLAAAIRAKAKVIGDDATAKQILIYYDLARRQDEAALFYLYKMVETIENKFGGEYEAIKTVGASTEWKAVKRLANESYRDARHAPKPGEVVKKWTDAEIKDCFKNTERVVMAYFETLFPALPPRPTAE